MTASRSVEARFAVVFTDTRPGLDSLPPGTPIKTVHFLEAFDAIARLMPSNPPRWTAGAPAAGAPVRASQMNDVRRPLGLLGVAAGDVVRAADLDSVRAAIRALD
jgi:hypothetical protein